MSKSMLVNVVNDEESRIAIVADGRLEELSIETAENEQIEGNIYKARIVKVIASLDAVFVDYGRERNGFLAAPDIHAQYFKGDKRDVDALRKGQDLLVQVKKGEIGNKGAALTTFVSLPGRHFVLMPQVSKRGVSRKIDDEATRKQLRKILDDTGIPEEMGYIARTAAEGRTKQELTRDAGYLLKLWKTIQGRFDKSKAPALLYEETDIVIRTLRDYFTPAIQEVLIDNEGIYRQVESFFHAVMPQHKKRLKLHQAQAPLFSKHNLEDQIASIYDKTVPLPSGGSLVIEQTEALVSIDVNSGRTTSGKDIEETALIANKEAAEEVARQLRLRDMGGLIVIDFIDMRPAKNRSEVRKVLQKALKEDKARTDTGTISKFGLLELSRQRIKGVARAGASQACPVCNGLGSIRTPESSALSVLRRIQLRLPRKGAVRQVLVGVAGPVATLLQNRHRDKLLDLESRFDTEVLVFAEEALASNQFYLEYRIKGRSEVETNLPEAFNRARLLAPQGLPDLPNRTRRPTLYALLDEEPDTTEVPEEPVTAEEAAVEAEVKAADDAVPAEGEASEAPREGGRKRRRRRRRGRGSRSDDTGEDARPSGNQGHSAAEAAAAEADAEAAELLAEHEEPPKPTPLSASAKRRQRRRRATARTREEGRAEGGSPQPVDRAEDQFPRGDEVELAPEAEDGADAPPVEEKPKRTRRPRRRKPAAGDTAEPAAAAQVKEAPAAEPQAGAADGETAATAEEKPKRSRRARKPKAEAEATEAEPAASADAAAPEGEEVAPKKAPAKPRRTRKKAAAEPAAEAEAPAEEAKPARKTRSRAKPKAEAAGPAAAAADSDEAPAPKKPARRRTAKAKAAEEAPEKPASEAAPAAEKPARKTRSRAKPKAEAAAADDEAAPAPKKPARRKTAKAKVAEEAPAGEDSAPVAKKPARKTSTRAKPKAGADASAAGDDEAPAPKKPARRRKAAKPKADDGEPTGSE